MNFSQSMAFNLHLTLDPPFSNQAMLQIVILAPISPFRGLLHRGSQSKNIFLSLYPLALVIRDEFSLFFPAKV